MSEKIDNVVVEEKKVDTTVGSRQEREARIVKHILAWILTLGLWAGLSYVPYKFGEDGIITMFLIMLFGGQAGAFVLFLAISELVAGRSASLALAFVLGFGFFIYSFFQFGGPDVLVNSIVMLLLGGGTFLLVCGIFVASLLGMTDMKNIKLSS